jgi:hypothetical protein
MSPKDEHEEASRGNIKDEGLDSRRRTYTENKLLILGM